MAISALEPALDVPRAPTTRRLWADWVTPWRFFALVAALGALIVSVHTFSDIDIYWHVRLGGEIVHAHSLHGAGRTWTYTFQGSSWVTTQWLSEVVMYGAWCLGGWAALAALRLVLAAVVMLALARLLLPGRRTIAAAVVFAVTLLAAFPHMQERPVLASLALMPWLAGVAHRLRAGERVSPVAVAAVTWLWANLHGYWVLVPFTLGLVAVGEVLESSRGRQAARRTLGLVGLSLLAAACTPVGPRLLLTPFAFAGATKYIAEWAPTTFVTWPAWPYAVLLGLLLVAWARGTVVPRSEIFFTFGVAAFSMTAIRNVIPAAILLSPIVADRLGELFPREDRADSDRERSRLAVALVASVAVAAVFAAVKFAQTPVVQTDAPVRLAKHLAAEPGPRRVLNDYNLSGYLLTWGGQSTQLAVDGRADRYGGAFLTRYLQLQSMYGDWRPFLRELDPNYAVLDSRSALAQELQREGWRKDYTQNSWVLLRRP